MATDDQQILVTGTAPAPATWLVPGNGQVTPRTVYAHYDGTNAANSFFPALQIVSDAGQTIGIYPCATAVAAGGSANVSWFPGADLDTGTAASSTGITLEQIMYDTRTTGITSSSVLTSGVSYLITVQGTWSLWNLSLNVGSPNANAMFPTSGGTPRNSTQVGLDAETLFAYPSIHPQTIGHTPVFEINTGGGYVHVEPQGGPFATPQTNYLYRYTVTGAGGTVSFRVNDAVGAFSDNYGYLQIIIYGLSGSSSGGGGGSLLPPDGADYSVLQPLSGVYSWSSVLDGGSA